MTQNSTFITRKQGKPDSHNWTYSMRFCHFPLIRRFTSYFGKPAFLAGCVFLVCYACFANPFPGVDLPDHFQFQPDHAGVKFSLSQHVGEYTAEEKLYHEVRVKFKNAGREAFVLEATKATTFRADGNILYVAHICESASGGVVAAYSFDDGRLLWERRLKAVGPIGHFAYRSYVNLDLTTHTVVITGHESYGDYVEVFHRGTGWRLAHKLYREGYPEWKPGDSPFLPE